MNDQKNGFSKKVLGVTLTIIIALLAVIYQITVSAQSNTNNKMDLRLIKVEDTTASINITLGKIEERLKNIDAKLFNIEVKLNKK